MDDYVAPLVEDQARPDPIIIIMRMVQDASHYSGVLPLQANSPIFLPYARPDLYALGLLVPGPMPGAGQVFVVDD